MDQTIDFAVIRPIDYFTDSLHSPGFRQICLSLGLCKDSGLWKMVGIPTGLMIPTCIAVYLESTGIVMIPDLYLD